MAWTLYAPTTRWDPARVSRYGMRAGRWHHGVDLYAPAGEPVVAVADGYVEAAVPSGAPGFARYGNVVLLKHRDGTRTLYAHLASRPRVRAGETIAAGTVLGEVGDTSGTVDDPHAHFTSSAPHLHFETLVGPYPASSGPDGDHVGSRSVDPFAWFAARGAQLHPGLRPSRALDVLAWALVGLAVAGGLWAAWRASR